MKAETYNALASLNSSFDLILESLKILKDEGVLSASYVEDQTICLEENRAGINFRIIHKLDARETEDRDHYGKMRLAIEKRLQETSPQLDQSSPGQKPVTQNNY